MTDFIGKPGLMSVLPSQVGHQNLAAVPHVKDLNSAVRRAGGESRPIIIHLGIVLRQEEEKSQGKPFPSICHETVSADACEQYLNQESRGTCDIVRVRACNNRR